MPHILGAASLDGSLDASLAQGPISQTHNRQGIYLPRIFGASVLRYSLLVILGNTQLAFYQVPRVPNVSPL